MRQGSYSYEPGAGLPASRLDLMHDVRDPADHRLGPRVDSCGHRRILIDLIDEVRSPDLPAAQVGERPGIAAALGYPMHGNVEGVDRLGMAEKVLDGLGRGPALRMREHEDPEPVAGGGSDNRLHEHLSSCHSASVTLVGPVNDDQ